MRVIDECSADLLALIELDWPRSTCGQSIDKILPSWLTYRSRAVVNLKRRVVCSNRVKSVKLSYPAIDKIIELFRSGGDLRPYLHKQIFTRMQDEDADLLFLDWGIHHFHLGEANVSQSVARTSNLLFAYINGDEVFLLDVQPHGVWSEVDLIRAMVEVAPQVAQQYQMIGVVGLSHETEAAQRSKLRKNGVNTPINVDGKYYSNLGGGISCAITRVDSQRKADQLFVEIAELKRQIENGAIVVTAKNIPPFTGPIVKLRADFRAGRIVVYNEGSGEVLIASPVIS